jgi:hypothetical protein
MVGLGRGSEVVMVRVGWVLLAAVACDEPDPEPPGEPCAWDAPADLEAGTDIAASGVLRDGVDLPYGTPPQGGAAYAPFQVRVHGAPPEDLSERWVVSGAAYDAATDEPLGDAAQPQAFFCSNTGVHEGWLFGGEVHIRFWDVALEALADREVRVEISAALPDGQTPTTSATGTLRWRLGPGAPQ